MLFRRSDDSTAHRGQALVEFAIVLPLLALLLVMAIDFGRVFFGWVSVTNASRVAANFAAQYPEAWRDGDTDRLDEYESLVRSSVTGCTLPGPVPAPTFSDEDGDGDAYGVSDETRVSLRCDFTLITPLAGDIVGQPLNIGGATAFPIRVGEVGLPPGSGGNPPCSGIRVPNMVNMTVEQARDFWTVSGFNGAFTALPNNDDHIVQTQTLSPIANVNDCVDPSSSVFVTATPPPPCPSGQRQVPNMMGQLLPAARSAWTGAGFTGGFSPSSGHNDKVVLTQTTSPTNVTPGGCLASNGSVTVTYGNPPVPNCDVPSMVGLTAAAAGAEWTAAGFSTSLSVSGRGSIVDRQDPQHPGTVPCDIRGRIWMRN